MRHTPNVPVEPWVVRETSLDVNTLGRMESVFALSNGHIGLRGNLDEGDPHGLPGTYLNSFFELRPLPYAEAGYGYPESGQTLVNVTNGKILRLLVDDEPFDVRYGRLDRHERVLDLRSGLLTREAHWTSPAGKQVKVRSTRLVSFTQRGVAAIHYEVEAVGSATRVILQSELVANEELPGSASDPRVAAALENPLVGQDDLVHGSEVLLLHRTRHSGLLMAAGMDHQVDGPGEVTVKSWSSPDLGDTTVACVLQPGERLTIIKYLAYGWSSSRSVPAVRDQVVAALAGARFEGWDGLVAAQREYLDTFWDSADVELEGDPEVQQAVRLALFHVLQAGARAELRPIAAKGLTGTGYDGHVFWDTERYVLPMLTFTQPKAVADALRWRHSTLGMACERATALGLRGAAFPWRTIRGQECSAYWPAGTAAFHVSGGVADAVLRYVQATGDEEFAREVGVELLIETARLWRSLGHHDRDGHFHLDGVTGPDEYSAVMDDNVYTNLVARRNLTGAATAVTRHPDLAERHGVDNEEVDSWRTAAASMYLPFDEELGVHPQAAMFTRYQEWDFVGTDEDKYPLLLHFPYFDLYRKQVVKQSDLVLAMHWFTDAFTPEQKAANFAYYEARTVRDSSLSACTQAVLAAETGHLELAHDYIGEAALLDLEDLHHNAGDGVHLASLAGAWLALVAGLGGLRDDDGTLAFSPRLPTMIDRLSFSVLWRGLRLRVTTMGTEVTYELRDTGREAQLQIRHHGKPLTVTTGAPVTAPIPELGPIGDRPSQPPGRAPIRRSV